MQKETTSAYEQNITKHLLFYLRSSTSLKSLRRYKKQSATNMEKREKPPRPSVRNHLIQQRRVRHPHSTRSAHILVLGPPNAGKSATINTLFAKREISNTSNFEGSSAIQEFSTNFRDQKNLKIVDVPGLGNPHNAVWDAKVLATLKKYLDTDDQLRHCIPNVILIVGRFDDPKLNNPDGSFVKSLKAINLLNARLFDKLSCNVVILLSHFMQGKKGYKTNVSLRQDEVMDLVRNYTTFPQMPYIIIGENDGGEWDMDNFHHPDYGTGCCSLNESTIYPSNLIDLIIKISGGSTKGALGPDFFRNVFQSRESVFLWKSCNLPLVSSDRQRFRRAFYLLKEVYKSTERLADQ